MESRELTHDQKCQIAALAASGKTAEEIATAAHADLTKTILFLESRENGKKKEYVKLTPELRNEEFEKATDKLIEEMRAEKENGPASAATEHKPITSNMEERHIPSIPQNDNSCQELVDEVVMDLVKISNWCCTRGDEATDDYIHMLGFIQGFTEALADKYRRYRIV